MNILPKKRWHVRTKENIARVRRDEAEAAEKEKLENQRIENADREARLNILKNKSKEKLLQSGIVTQHEVHSQESSEHINLFSDLEHTAKSTNKEHDKEVKETKEEYEKQIGYLTYLGQDTNEALGKKNWYEVLPESSRFNRSNEIKDTYNKLVLKDPDGKIKSNELDIKDGEIAWKAKQRLDPMNHFKEFLPKKTKQVTHPKDIKSRDFQFQSSMIRKKIIDKKKHNKDNKHEKLQKLREARLKREQQEKQKTDTFLAGLSGLNSKANVKKQVPVVKPKYNSQFNPELARQNYM